MDFNKEIAEMLIRLALQYKNNGMIEIDCLFSFGKLQTIYFQNYEIDVKIAYGYINEKISYQVKLDLEKCEIKEIPDCDLRRFQLLLTAVMELSEVRIENNNFNFVL
jgi:hypothetical protein